MEWISIKDKEPPKDGTPFLCYDPQQSSNFDKAQIYVVVWDAVQYFRDACFVEAGGECYFEWKPTHWMPLPKPPKE